MYRTHVLSISHSEKSEQGKEKVDDVNVQSNSSKNIFIIGVAFYQVISIIDDVSTEDNRSESSIDHDRDLPKWKQDLRKLGK